jgi:ABC-type uncharacterized transport system ATPase subunit
MLEAVELTKRYNTQVALDRLNLTINPGEVFCLLGANGAGQTTTINLFLRRVLVGLLGLAVPAACIGWLGLRRLRRYPIAS